MKLHEKIAKLKGKEKHLAKANAIAACGVGQYGKYYVEEISVEGDLLKIVVKGQEHLNPFYFKNPPIMVNDENGDILRKNEKGEVVRKLRCDPKQAITEALEHTILISNK